MRATTVTNEMKNERRKEERDIALRGHTKNEVREARRWRRVRRGAFGNSIHEDFNFMAIGTVGQHAQRGN